MRSSQKIPTNTKHGMTLPELTVVILILFTFMGVFLVGVRAWMSQSDRSNSIIMIRNTQQAVRGYANTMGQVEGSIEGLPTQIFGAQRFINNGLDSSGNQRPDGELPDHPASERFFAFASSDPDLIPPTGMLYICTVGLGGTSDAAYDPPRSVYERW